MIKDTAKKETEIFEDFLPICEVEEENVIEETEPMDISQEDQNVEWMEASRNISLMTSQINEVKKT